jgi:hypothetical protein
MQADALMHVSKTYRVSMYRVFLRARHTLERKSLIHVISRDERMHRYRLGTFVTRSNTYRERQMIVKIPFVRYGHRLRFIRHAERLAEKHTCHSLLHGFRSQSVR